MLVGCDKKQILRRRFKAAGARVISVSDATAALDCARHEFLQAAVVVSQRALIDDTETVFNLHDLNRSLEVILLVDRMTWERNRLLRQLIEHPIEGTRLVTWRQMQKQPSVMLAGDRRLDPRSRRGCRWRL